MRRVRSGRTPGGGTWFLKLMTPGSQGMTNGNHRRGLSLVELLVVMTIVGMLFGLLLPTINIHSL